MLCWRDERKITTVMQAAYAQFTSAILSASTAHWRADRSTPYPTFRNYVRIEKNWLSSSTAISTLNRSPARSYSESFYSSCLMLPRSTRIILHTLLPSQSHAVLPYGIDEIGFEHFYAELMRTATTRLKIVFRLAVWCALWISPLLIGRAPPLTRYEDATRARALAAMAQSRFYLVRQMLLVLKLVVGLCYGADPSVRAALNYPVATATPEGNPRT